MHSVLETYISRPVFVSLKKHMKECSALVSHLIFLIKAIAKQYFLVRLHYAEKAFMSNLIKKKQIKCVIFSGLWDFSETDTSYRAQPFACTIMFNKYVCCRFCDIYEENFFFLDYETHLSEILQ